MPTHTHKQLLLCSWAFLPPSVCVVDEKVAALRHELRVARKNVVLWKKPFTTLFHFFLELGVIVFHIFEWCVPNFQGFAFLFFLFLVLVLLVSCSCSYFPPLFLLFSSSSSFPPPSPPPPPPSSSSPTLASCYGLEHHQHLKCLSQHASQLFLGPVFLFLPFPCIRMLQRWMLVLGVLSLVSFSAYILLTTTSPVSPPS